MPKTRSSRSCNRRRDVEKTLGRYTTRFTTYKLRESPDDHFSLPPKRPPLLADNAFDSMNALTPQTSPMPLYHSPGHNQNLLLQRNIVTPSCGVYGQAHPHTNAHPHANVPIVSNPYYPSGNIHESLHPDCVVYGSPNSNPSPPILPGVVHHSRQNHFHEQYNSNIPAVRLHAHQYQSDPYSPGDHITGFVPSPHHHAVVVASRPYPVEKSVRTDYCSGNVAMSCPPNYGVDCNVGQFVRTSSPTTDGFQGASYSQATFIVNPAQTVPCVAASNTAWSTSCPPVVGATTAAPHFTNGFQSTTPPQTPFVANPGIPAPPPADATAAAAASTSRQINDKRDVIDDAVLIAT